MSTIIDAKGKPCPTPVILAKQAMAAGEHSFTVLVDNHPGGGGVFRGLHPYRLRRL